MGLDAFVYCDCFERDALRSDPPAGVKLTIAPNGNILCQSHQEEIWSAFSAWKCDKACLHAQMILTHRDLGQDETIDRIRTEILPERHRFPILLGRVLYNATHTCDWIPVQELASLSGEVSRLSHCRNGGNSSDAVHLFQIEMAELIIAAQMVNKPICF